MADDFKLDETGINLSETDSHGEEKDVYFTNQDYSGIKTDKKATGAAAKKANKKKTKIASVSSTYWFFIIVIVVSMVISVYAIFALMIFSE